MTSPDAVFMSIGQAYPLIAAQSERRDVDEQMIQAVRNDKMKLIECAELYYDTNSGGNVELPNIWVVRGNAFLHQFLQLCPIELKTMA